MAGIISPAPFRPRHCSKEIDSGIRQLETPIAMMPASHPETLLVRPSSPGEVLFEHVIELHRRMKQLQFNNRTASYGNGRKREFLLQQLLRPAAACIFTGNLPNWMPRTMIADKLYSHFNLYGNCEVAVHKSIQPDNSGGQTSFNYALIQYKEVDDAMLALKYADYTVYQFSRQHFGRSLRIQPCIAKRTVTINLGPTNEQVLLELMSSFGAIEEWRRVRGEYGWVGYEFKYMMYGGYKAAKQYFKQNFNVNV